MSIPHLLYKNHYVHLPPKILSRSLFCFLGVQREWIFPETTTQFKKSILKIKQLTGSVLSLSPLFFNGLYAPRSSIPLFLLSRSLTPENIPLKTAHNMGSLNLASPPSSLSLSLSLSREWTSAREIP